MTSNELRNLVTQARLSIAELARRTGVPYTTLHSFFSGTTDNLRADTFNRVVRAVGSFEPPKGGVSEEIAAFEHSDVLLSVPKDLLDASRDYGIDVETILVEGGVPRLREVFKQAYLERNRDAIDRTNDYIREHGTPSEQLGMI